MKVFHGKYRSCWNFICFYQLLTCSRVLCFEDLWVRHPEKALYKISSLWPVFHLSIHYPYVLWGCHCDCFRKDKIFMKMHFLSALPFPQKPRYHSSIEASSHWNLRLAPFPTFTGYHIPWMTLEVFFLQSSSLSLAQSNPSYNGL